MINIDDEFSAYQELRTSAPSRYIHTGPSPFGKATPRQARLVVIGPLDAACVSVYAESSDNPHDWGAADSVHLFDLRHELDQAKFKTTFALPPSNKPWSRLYYAVEGKPATRGAINAHLVAAEEIAA